MQIPAKFRSRTSFRNRFRSKNSFRSGITIFKFRCFLMDLHYVISPNRPICTTPPLRSVPRPIGEAFAFAFWASRLTKQPISGKLTLSQLQDEEKTTGISPKFRETEPSGSDSAVWQTGTKTGICNLGFYRRTVSICFNMYLDVFDDHTNWLGLQRCW